MCKECDTLLQQLAATRLLSTELTDPCSIVLNNADIKALEERLIKTMAKHIAAKKD